MACELEDNEPIISVLGCTDPLALNYFSGATVDDGSCLYPEPISGCTDPFAINYNEEATIEDCSCIYSECPDTIYITETGFVYYTVESEDPTNPKPIAEVIDKGGLNLEEVPVFTGDKANNVKITSLPLPENCCTEEIVGEDVTWNGKNCVLTSRLDCPEEIIIGDNNVVYYFKTIEQVEGELIIGKRFLGGNRILLNQNCCTESVVGQPVTWDPNFVVNTSRIPGACILDNLPEECELTLEDVIYVGDTVVINCLIPPIEEDVPDDIGDTSIIDDTKDCINIQLISLGSPESLFDSPNGYVPHVVLVTSDVNVLTYQVGDVLELTGFGVINNTCFNNIDINGQVEILYIHDLTSFNGFYYIWLNVTTVEPVGCTQDDFINVITNGFACPIEGVDFGDIIPECLGGSKYQFQSLSLSGIIFPELGLDYQTLCNEQGLNGDDYYLYVTLTTLPTTECQTYFFDESFKNNLENGCWGQQYTIQFVDQAGNQSQTTGQIDLSGYDQGYKLLYYGEVGGNIIGLFNLSIPFEGGYNLEVNNNSCEVTFPFEMCLAGGKSINKSTLQDTTTDFNFNTKKEEVSYTEGIVLTYQQDSPTQCGEYYTNSNIDLDPFIFNNTIKNTILELNYNVGNQNCCNGYFQITIIGPNNFQETIQSNQTQQIILPNIGQYEITLDLVSFNCSSSLSVISKTPQEKFLSSIDNLIELIGSITIPILLDPCDTEVIEPITCPNLSEICCTTLGADLGWQFIDGVCYWNPPAQPTDIEIGISENDIFIPDSGCTDLNVSLFFYMEKPDDPTCLGDENITATLAFYSGDSMGNDVAFSTVELSNFNLGRDGYCNWVLISSQITGYAGENFKIKLILNNVLDCCDYNIFVDDIKVDCVKQDSITVTNKFQCPGFKLDRVIDNKKSWVYNDGLPINRIFAPSPDADLPWRYTDYLEQSGVYEKHSKLVLNSKEMEITFNMCNTSNCTPNLTIFELLEYKNNFQSFWIKFIEQFVPATTIFVAGEKWCAKAEDICPVYEECDYDNNFNLKDLGVIQEDSKPNKPKPPLAGKQIEVNSGANTPESEKSGDWGKNNKPNGEPVVLDGFVGSFIEDRPSDVPEKLTFRRGELPLLKDGMRTYISKFSSPQIQIVNG